MNSARSKKILLACLLAALPVYADLVVGLDAAAKQDWKTAYREFQESANHGNANAEVNLGNLYMRGLGVEQNYEAARRWYEKAALQGNPIAEAKLGVIYYYGLGVPESRPFAAEWLQKAADQGDAHSAMILGEMYSSGDGIAKDRNHAYVWYTISQELGNHEADLPRNTLASELSSLEIHNALERVNHWRESYAAQVEKANRQASREVRSPEAGATRGTAPADPAKKPSQVPAPEKGQTKDSAKTWEGLDAKMTRKIN